jgi:hypothetical protein
MEYMVQCVGSYLTENTSYFHYNDQPVMFRETIQTGHTNECYLQRLQTVPTLAVTYVERCLQFQAPYGPVPVVSV